MTDRVGFASAQGSGEFCFDAAARHDFYETTAVTVIDGIGRGPGVNTAAALCAEVAVRVGARNGELAGIMAAAELLTDNRAVRPTPNAVGVLAVRRPGNPIRLAYVGDCRAWGFSGGTLHQLTVDHNLGEQMRQQGLPEEIASQNDNVVLTTLGRATVATTPVSATDAPLVVLTTDGVHGVLDLEAMVQIIKEHKDEGAQKMADEMVAAALEVPPSASGYKDDMTVAVLYRD
ncbi:hypothetical protein D5S17_15325 [Pseudonocardiaceae bacterium YIM PH 21723]|nr:hypothetical protein D5S17_15325 [Pseudonocardiaceae bacterium YIM PH 21723]